MIYSDCWPDAINFQNLIGTLIWKKNLTKILRTSKSISERKQLKRRDMEQKCNQMCAKKTKIQTIMILAEIISFINLNDS